MDGESWSSEETEFLAEETPILVVSRSKLPKLSLLGGEYGPFEPLEEVQVPLWLAVQLRKADKCRIRLPEWMAVERLREHQRQEQKEDRYFQELPFHYLEVAAVILRVAADDLAGDAAEIRALIDDIYHLRQSKIRRGVESIQAGTTVVKLNNMSAMELNAIRAFTLRALNEFRALAAEEDKAARRGAAPAAPAAAAAAAAASAPPTARAAAESAAPRSPDAAAEADATAAADSPQPARRLRRFRP